MIPDQVNGCFEFIGALACWWNVLKLLDAKYVAGVSPLSTVFFTSWGFWNLFYYWNLHQYWSLAGAVFLLSANLSWIVMAYYYIRKAARVDETRAYMSV